MTSTYGQPFHQYQYKKQLLLTSSCKVAQYMISYKNFSLFYYLSVLLLHCSIIVHAVFSREKMQSLKQNSFKAFDSDEI
jgi:hypothetical protein